MLLKDYIKSLNDFISKNPEYNNLEVYYASDPEDNVCYPIEFPPSLSYFDGDSGCAEEDLDDYEPSDYKKIVIIN